MTPLEQILKSQIATQGPMSVAEYMSTCLLHPEHGYYSTRDPFGAGGDFITAPEISQMFGELIGLTLGFGAVVLIAANSGSFEGDVTLWWIAVALVAPSFYALEGNVVAKWGTYGFDAIETLFWSSVFGLVPSLLLALGTGQFIPVPTTWGPPEFAFLIIAVAHAVVYAGYVWLVSNAGPVFAAQVSYLVTIFGIFWAIVLLHEAYANGIWLALALMLSGMFLVQPRARKSEEEALA